MGFIFTIIHKYITHFSHGVIHVAYSLSHKIRYVRLVKMTSRMMGYGSIKRHLLHLCNSGMRILNRLQIKQSIEMSLTYIEVS